MPLTLTSVSFTYPTQEKPVFEDLTLTFDKGWTGIVGANGTGKTTLLNLISGKLSPTSGVVKSPGKVVYCAQSADRPPENLPRVLAHRDGPSAELFGRLKLQEDWLERWDTLSNGEKKRAQIACALLESPEVLQLDEPTNHVDTATRNYLAGALVRYRGIGLLVSHDRELLDRLCTSCVFIEPGTVTLRAGSYSQAHEQANRELDTKHRQQENAARQHAALQAEMAKRREVANSANDKRSKRNLDKYDSDGRFRLNLARRSGKDGQAGKLMKQLEGRLHQAELRVAELTVSKRPKLDPALAGVQSLNPVLLHVDAMELPVAGRKLLLPALDIGSGDRIAICGPERSGKSMIVRALLARLTFPPMSLVHIPQELDPSAYAARLGQIRGMPAEQLALVENAVSCLGLSPERLLHNDKPSVGEMRTLLLASGLARGPNLVVLDEPTRSMDLPSIEALEDCLAQLRCALLLVSHDERLVRRLCPIRWQIEEASDGLRLSVCPNPVSSESPTEATA